MLSVVYAGEYPGMFAGGPLLEEIRLDNATIRQHNRKVGVLVNAEQKRARELMTAKKKNGATWSGGEFRDD